MDQVGDLGPRARWWNAGGTLVERWWPAGGPLVERWWNAGGTLVAQNDIELPT